MAPKRTQQRKKKPALKDLQSFEGSYHLTRVMRDTMVAFAVKSENDGPGFSATPDLIKIDARNGQGLLMDYDVNLNMKTELMMLHPYCGRPVEEIAYYMSLEQSPVGGLGLSYKQWLDILRGKPVENLDKFPVSPEVRKRVTEWLQGLATRLSVNEGTETLVQDIIDARFGDMEEETSDTEGESDGRHAGARMEVYALE